MPPPPACLLALEPAPPRMLFSIFRPSPSQGACFGHNSDVRRKKIQAQRQIFWEVPWTVSQEWEDTVQSDLSWQCCRHLYPVTVFPTHE